MRLIDADELLQDPYFQDESIPERLLFIEAVESAPTINPEDLRPKGRWEPNRPGKTNTRTIYRCSKCGHSNGRYFNDKFCRGCGAKMTEEA